MLLIGAVGRGGCRSRWNRR